MMQRVAAIAGPHNDDTNIFLWRTGEHYFATSDTTALTNSFDLKTLAPLGYTQVQDAGHGVFTGAHKQREIGGDATIGWVGTLDLRGRPLIRVYKDDAKTLKRTFFGQALAGPSYPMIHSFQVTADYIILAICSLHIDVGHMGEMISGKLPFNGLSMMSWDASHNASILVWRIPKDDAPVDAKAAPMRDFAIEPMYFNHHINAQQLGERGEEEILLDLVGYADGAFLSDPHGFGNLKVMRNKTARDRLHRTQLPEVRRYELNMSVGAQPFAPYSTFALMADSGEGPFSIEMPRFNDKHHGSAYCFVYSMGDSQQDTDLRINRLVKSDLCADPEAAAHSAVRHAARERAAGAPWRASVQQWHRRGHYASEPIFVPRPGATAEDDGVVLSVVLDGNAARSYLLVLDAANMKPLATAYAPVVMPYDVHGQFFTQDGP